MLARLLRTQEKLAVEEKDKRKKEGTKVADNGSFIKLIVFLSHLISL